MLTNLDLWIGKTLFVPLIVKLCLLTRQTQFAISRLFWFIAALDGFYRAETLFSSILFGGLSIFMMVIATRRPDLPTSSFLWFRMLALVMLVFDGFSSATSGEWAGVEFWILVLIAEYASTIETLPPSESRKAVLEGAAKQPRS